MKLTPELLAQAQSALNPIKERQLDLRGQYKPRYSLHRSHIHQGIKFQQSRILVLQEYALSVVFIDPFSHFVHL